MRTFVDFDDIAILDCVSSKCNFTFPGAHNKSQQEMRSDHGVLFIMPLISRQTETACLFTCG